MSTPSENLIKRKLLNKYSERFKRQKTTIYQDASITPFVTQGTSSSYIYQEASTSAFIPTEEASTSAGVSAPQEESLTFQTYFSDS